MPNKVIWILLAAVVFLYSLRSEAVDRIYTVSWLPTVTRTDGSVLTNLANYTIYRGASCALLDPVKTVGPGVTSTTVVAPRGEWCWAVLAIDANGMLSEAEEDVWFFTDADSDSDGVHDWQDNCTMHFNPSQADSDVDGYGNRCDGDLNGNGFTTAQDYVLFSGQLGKPSAPPVYNPADLNANGFVNSFDVAIFRNLLGFPPGPTGVNQ